MDVEYYQTSLKIEVTQSLKIDIPPHQTIEMSPVQSHSTFTNNNNWWLDET